MHASWARADDQGLKRQAANSSGVPLAQVGQHSQTCGRHAAGAGPDWLPCQHRLLCLLQLPPQLELGAPAAAALAWLLPTTSITGQQQGLVKSEVTGQALLHDCGLMQCSRTAYISQVGFKTDILGTSGYKQGIQLETYLLARQS